MLEDPLASPQGSNRSDLREQLSETLMTAAICADEIRAIVKAELDSVRKSQVVPTEAATRIRPGVT